MSLTPLDVENTVRRMKVPWFNHTDGVTTFPEAQQVPRYLGITLSRMQTQADRIEANQRLIMDKLGISQ